MGTYKAFMERQRRFIITGFLRMLTSTKEMGPQSQERVHVNSRVTPFRRDRSRRNGVTRD